jgi:hypothetical protein
MAALSRGIGGALAAAAARDALDLGPDQPLDHAR